MLMTEIIARVLKNQLNSFLRKEMEKICIPSKDPYLVLMAKFLNRVLIFILPIILILISQFLDDVN
jgi:hypothetical protein